jgi:hypothetical protein
VISLSEADVRKTLKGVNTQKATGPEGISGCFFIACAEQLEGIFSDIFMSRAVAPTCFKETTIVTVPKKTEVTCLNDYRPIVFTPVMNCFERLVMAHIKARMSDTLDPLQFAHNRSTP